MSTTRNPTRQRLIGAALELFTAQGVTETTTKQISERAEVNEVTLFRHFGSKHGLLLAVIEEAAVFRQLGQTLVQQANQASSIEQALQDYAKACLLAMEGVPEVVRSVVGEAGQYPAKNRQALGRGFTQANRYVAEYFQTVIDRGQFRTHLPAETLASLLNGMLLGYAVIEFTSELHELWHDREEFIEHLVTLFLQGAVSPMTVSEAHLIRDLPSSTVHHILQRAKKRGLQDFAIAYVLFAAGLSATEIVQLQRGHLVQNHQQLILQTNSDRQVPINQWILGKRYGTGTKNPLTQWLRSRKDSQGAMFLNAAGEAIAQTDLQQLWQALTDGLAHHSLIEQAQQTWCIELLMRGVTLEELQILTGKTGHQLRPYLNRAKEKAAIEQVSRLDKGSLIER